MNIVIVVELPINLFRV